MDTAPATRQPDSQARDYARIEKAIRFLDAHFTAQPDLDAIAAAVHLSPYHFQRLFSRWAGISPTRFMHYLTVAYAKGLLEEQASVLDAALEAGTSGPGRLHDLFVTFEAMTPGEAKRRGAGLNIRYGLHEGPFGTFHVFVTERGVSGLEFVDGDSASVLAAQQRRWPLASFREDQAGTADIAARIFSPRDKRPALNLLVSGTNFQIKVWEALLKVPAGRLASYGGLARAIGNEQGSRAVGNALAHNPIAYLIPCHRVIRATGAHDSYRWGRARRQAILGWEAAQWDVERAPAA